MKIDKRFALVLALSVSMTSTIARAQNPDVSNWVTKTQAEPSNALNYFNLGVAYHLRHDFKSALAAYQKVIELGSALSPAALFYEAQIYETQQDRKKAKDIIASIPVNSVPPNLRQRLLQMKNRLFLEDFAQETDIGKNAIVTKPEIEAVSSSDERSLSAFADLSRGQNSNPQTLSDTSASTTAPASPQTVAKAGITYQPWASSIHDLKLGYYFSGTFFDKASSANYVYHELNLPLSFYFSSYRLKLMPEYFTDTYGGSEFSRAVGGTLELTVKYDASYVSFALQNQSISNLTAAYSYLTGTQQKAQLSVQSQWSTSRVFGYVSYSRFNYEDSATLGSSYGAAAVSAGYSVLWLPFDVSLVAYLETRVYTQAASDATARADLRKYVDLQLGYLLTRSLRIYADANMTQNDSNFNSATNDRTYSQSIYSAGLSWTY